MSLVTNFSTRFSFLIPFRLSRGIRSTCFIHHLSSGIDKLQARLLKCVFLDYHRFQKIIVANLLIFDRTSFRLMLRFSEMDPYWVDLSTSSRRCVYPSYYSWKCGVCLTYPSREPLAPQPLRTTYHRCQPPYIVNVFVWSIILPWAEARCTLGGRDILIFGLNFSDTYSPIVKMTFVSLLVSVAAIWQWHQIKIRNGDIRMFR